MTIRFAILAGVSTDAQAHEEKASIPDQIQFCRDRLKHEGLETAGPFILDGYSRTNYDSLEVAMQDIPHLGDAINAARSDQYDVLIMDNYDRLGDLGLMVGTRFRKLHKQLYSVRQSGKIYDPKTYDPYATEAADIDMHVEGIINRYRINKIRRGWNIGVPERARKGLHPLCTSFGYRTAGKDEPAKQIPEEIQLVRDMINLFLAGRTFQEICNHANKSDVKPRRSATWQIAVVKRIILNPYYAGITIFGRFKKVDGKRIPIPPSQWIRGRGQHEPIIDEATYAAILAEDERRKQNRARTKVYALTGVLSCAICHGRLYRHGKLNPGFNYPVQLTCETGYAHVAIEYDLALKFVAREVVKRLAAVPEETPLAGAAQGYDDDIAAQEALRATVQQGFEAKIYNLEEAHRRIVSIETEIERLARARDQLHHQHLQRQQLLDIARQDLATLQNWILHDDPATVNHLLTALCDTIEISPQYELHLIWR